MGKKQTLTEIVKGFNVPDGESEKRFEPGGFVTEKDFTPEDWKALVKMEAVRLVEKPLTEAEKDEIVFEKIEDK
jgi:hypothetical protein